MFDWNSRWRTFSLLFLLSLPVAVCHGQANTHGESCGSVPQRKSWPAPEPDAVTLHHREPKNSQQDTATASSFDAWRSFHADETVDLGVCYGNILVRRAAQPDKLHVRITLKNELPKGHTVADYIRQFTTDSKQTELYIDIPKKYRPEIVLEVPEPTTFDAGLGVGTVQFDSIPGNLDIGIGKGDLRLYTHGENDYSYISAGFGVGGVKDKRPGVRNHGHFANGWEEKGNGKYKVSFGAGWGHLVLLSR